MSSAGDDEDGVAAQVVPGVGPQAAGPARRGPVPSGPSRAPGGSRCRRSRRRPASLGGEVHRAARPVRGGDGIARRSVGSGIADPRVEYGVQEVDEQVGEQEDEDEDGHEADDGLGVLAQDALVELVADAVDVEDAAR